MNEDKADEDPNDLDLLLMKLKSRLSLDATSAADL